MHTPEKMEINPPARLADTKFPTIPESAVQIIIIPKMKESREIKKHIFFIIFIKFYYQCCTTHILSEHQQRRLPCLQLLRNY